VTIAGQRFTVPVRLTNWSPSFILTLRYGYVCQQCDRTVKSLYLRDNTLACQRCQRLYWPPKRPATALHAPYSGTGQQPRYRPKRVPEPKRAALDYRERRALRYGETPPAPTPAGGRPGKPPRA